MISSLVRNPLFSLIQSRHLTLAESLIANSLFKLQVFFGPKYAQNWQLCSKSDALYKPRGLDDALEEGNIFFCSNDTEQEIIPIPISIPISMSF